MAKKGPFSGGSLALLALGDLQSNQTVKRNAVRIPILLVLRHEKRRFMVAVKERVERAKSFVLDL